MPSIRPLTTAAVAATAVLVLGACATDGQSSEEAVTEDVVVQDQGDLDDDAATEDADTTAMPEFGDADVDYASSMLAHHKEMLTLADLGLEQGSDQIDGLAGELRSHRSEDAEHLASMLEEYGEESGEQDVDEPDTELSGMSGEEFDEAWLERVQQHNDEAITLIDQHHADGMDNELTRLSTELREVIEREMSDIDLLREALGQG